LRLPVLYCSTLVSALPVRIIENEPVGAQQKVTSSSPLTYDTPYTSPQTRHIACLAYLELAAEVCFALSAHLSFLYLPACICYMVSQGKNDCRGLCPWVELGQVRCRSD
jgi:hypothetical protein